MATLLFVGILSIDCNVYEYSVSTAKLVCIKGTASSIQLKFGTGAIFLEFIPKLANNCTETHSDVIVKSK